MFRTISILFLPILISFQCLEAPKSQMGMEANWKGSILSSSEKISLGDLPYEVLALNVYSPTCIPCFQELPALERIYSRLTKDKRFGMFIVVDPNQVSESTSGEYGINDPIQRAILIMKQEVVKRNIQIPVLLLDLPFKVSNESFVTATPETILIRTKPWNIYYNFIGSLSEESEISKIDSDSRVQFFFHQLGARNL
jgi:thiol-disulfide isomerase/thioredoxin